MLQVQPPSVRGEIKKARASNYTWLRAISEFFDNSIDVLLKDKDNHNLICKINLDCDSNEELVSFSISDNYTNGITDHNIWNWTYDRDRMEHDCGEYGTGFKSGSVNISNHLRLITKNGGNYTKVDADWNDMSVSNTWTPEFKEINEKDYKGIHPFDNGSTFVLKQLIKSNIPYDIQYLEMVLINHIKITYKTTK